MNKNALVDLLADQLAARMDGFEKSAREAHAEATHEQNKAENKYDTRAIEAGYLAEGQARQAAEVAAATQQLQTLRLPDFSSGTPVDLGALVELEAGKETTWYFLAPCAGGTILEHDGKEVIVLTPQSPLGQLLLGKRRGEAFPFPPGKKAVRHLVKSIQ